MPRPAGTQADRCTCQIGHYVANVSRSVWHEQLVHFIADRIRSGDQQRQLHTRSGDRSAKTTGKRAKHNHREAEVFNCMQDVIRDTAWRRRG